MAYSWPSINQSVIIHLYLLVVYNSWKKNMGMGILPTYSRVTNLKKINTLICGFLMKFHPYSEDAIGICKLLGNIFGWFPLTWRPTGFKYFNNMFASLCRVLYWADSTWSTWFCLRTKIVSNNHNSIYTEFKKECLDSWNKFNDQLLKKFHKGIVTNK